MKIKRAKITLDTDTTKHAKNNTIIHAQQVVPTLLLILLIFFEVVVVFCSKQGWNRLFSVEMCHVTIPINEKPRSCCSKRGNCLFVLSRIANPSKKAVCMIVRCSRSEVLHSKMLQSSNLAFRIATLTRRRSISNSCLFSIQSGRSCAGAIVSHLPGGH